MTDQILQRIDALAAKLGVTAPYLWGVLIKQARVEVLTDAICMVVFSVGIYVCYRVGRRYATVTSEDGGDILCVLCVGAAMIMLVSLIVVSRKISTPLFNPEFYALQQINELFK